MSFNIYQLEDLDYDQAEALLDDYIEDAIIEFAESDFAQPYIEKHQQGGAWIENFIYFAYVYEGFTLPKMTKKDVELVMEYILPRKLTIFDASEAEDAIPELTEFWRYLKSQYKFPHASKIIKYLGSLKHKFPRFMMDPNRGGFAKSFMLMGAQEGFDMTNPEELAQFQQEYNDNLRPQLQGKISEEDVIEHFKTKSAEQDPINIPTSLKAKFTEITAITDDFCQQYLNDEYQQLSHRLTATMCSEHPSVMAKGRAKSWACGVVHALGMVNFLSDPNNQPYLSASELYQKFGVSASTGSAKSKQIRDLLDMMPMDPDWCLPSNLEHNPLVSAISQLSEMRGLLDFLGKE